MEFETVRSVSARVAALRDRWQERDARMRDVKAVRHGNFDQVAPHLFSDDWPRPIVANIIDSSATSAAGALAPLPAVTCKVPTSLSEAAVKFGDKRTKIANGYLTHNSVAEQMHTAADQFLTYGMIVACVEPDPELGMPRINYEDSHGVYPHWNRRGDTVEVARVFTRTVSELMAEYPLASEQLRSNAKGGDLTSRMEVVKFVDATRVLMYVPDAGNLVLQDIPNALGECYYVCTKKPGLDDEIRGSYDDLIWVQLARHSLQVYALEAAQKSVQAPLVVPQDVGDVPMGPDAIIRTQAGRQAVGRVNLEVPNQVWGGIEHLKGEMLTSAVVPPSPGSIDASVISGTGVRELMGGYSMQIATAQEALKGHIRRVISLCFRIDQRVWPNSTKSLRGLEEGVRYDEKYTPGKDIDGDDTVEVSYGFQAGLDANRAMVLLLQAQGAGLVSRDFARRGLPGGINASEEETKISVENMRQSIEQSLSAVAQAIPQMVMGGQDPSAIVKALADATVLLNKGGRIEEVVAKVFAPAPPAEQAAPETPTEDPMAAMAAAMGGGGGAPPELAPGESPSSDMQMMFAGLSAAGKPQMSAGVSRMIPA